MYCKECGSKLREGAKFCEECGAKTDEPTPSSQEMPQAETKIDKYEEFKQRYAKPKVQEEVPQKKKHPFVTFLCVVLICAFIFTGFINPAFVIKFFKEHSPLPSYFKKGAEAKGTASDTQTVTIGSADKTGYTLNVSPNSFKDGTTVSMKVLSQKEADVYTSDTTEIVGTPVELSASKYDGSFFAGDVTLDVKIPSSMKDKEMSAHEYCAMYYDESAKTWIYHDIDYLDTDSGTLRATLPHFSVWSFGKLSKEEQTERFLDTFCRESARIQYNDEAAAQALVPYISNSLKNLDMTKTERNDVARSIAIMIASGYDTEANHGKPGTITSLIAAAWKAEESGDKSEFFNAAGETLAEKLTECLLECNNEGGAINPYISKTVGSCSSLAKAAGYAAGGDYKAAAGEILNRLATITPQGAVAMAAANYLRAKTNECFNNWKGAQIETLYQAYKNGYDDLWGNHVEPLNEESFWEFVDYPHGFVNSAGIYRFYNMDSIAKVCDQYGWTEKDFKSLPKEKKEIFYQRAKDGLMNYFKTRIQQEKIADVLKEKEKEFIDELNRKTNVLSSFAFSSFFGEERLRDYDYTKRLEKIYIVRQGISYLVDKKKMDNEYIDMFRVVEKWVSLFDKYDSKTAYDKFIEYLRDNKILNDELSAKNTNTLTIDNIAGCYNMNVTISNIQSDFSDFLESILGDAVEKHYDENTTYDIYYAVMIEPESDTKAKVSFYREFDDGTYSYYIYTGSYKDNVLTLKLSKDNSTGSDVQPKKITLTFSNAESVVTCVGEGRIESMMLDGDCAYRGKWTDTLD